MSLAFDNSEAGGCMLYYDCHRTVPAPFLTKTYHLVNDPSTDEIVSWGEDHTTFVVWRPPEFARDLLPNYFKHNNFSSFVRQLNTYGFRKVVPDRWEFANDFFRRGERHLLCEIHRRKALQQPSSGSGAQQSRSLSPSTSVEDQAWGSPISSPHPSPIPVHINVPPPVALAMPMPQQQHQQHLSPPLSISDENERLRKDNNMLLSEVSRLRRLYEEAFSMIQHQFKGSPPDHFTTLFSSARVGASGGHQSSADRALLMGPAAAAVARREENHRELSVHVRQPPATPDFFCKTAQYPPVQDHASLHQHHQHQQYQQQQLHRQHQQHQQQQQQQQYQLQQQQKIEEGNVGDSKLRVEPFFRKDANDCPPSTPEAKQGPISVKLFGVPLQHSTSASNLLEQPTLRHGLHAGEVVVPLAGTKRRQPEAHPHDRVFLRPPPGKCLQGSAEIAGELSRPAPWLQICDTRDERVYI